jgi:hypothetical protein
MPAWPPCLPIPHSRVSRCLPPRKADGELEVLTKGDNNAVDDRGLYAEGQHYLARSDVVGRAR